MKLYVIMDRVAEESTPPFMARTDGVAVRFYLGEMEKIKAHLPDYWLYKIGSYNTETMALLPLSSPIRVKVSEGLDMEEDSAKEGNEDV